MTSDDTETRDEEQRDEEGTDSGEHAEDGTDSEEAPRGDNTDSGESDFSNDSDESDDSDSDDSDDEKVKQDDRYSDRTPGVADARPGRDDIGESQMPSDYHEAVAQRPVEVKLPETPDLSEDAERNDD